MSKNGKGERKRRERQKNAMYKNNFILIIFATGIFEALHLILQMRWDCDVDNENVGEFMNKTSMEVVNAKRCIYDVCCLSVCVCISHNFDT